MQATSTMKINCNQTAMDFAKPITNSCCMVQCHKLQTSLVSLFCNGFIYILLNCFVAVVYYQKIL